MKQDGSDGSLPRRRTGRRATYSLTRCFYLVCYSALESPTFGTANEHAATADERRLRFLLS